MMRTTLYILSWKMSSSLFRRASGQVTDNDRGISYYDEFENQRRNIRRLHRRSLRVHRVYPVEVVLEIGGRKLMPINHVSFYREGPNVRLTHTAGCLVDCIAPDSPDTVISITGSEVKLRANPLRERVTSSKSNTADENVGDPKRNDENVAG